MSEKTEKTRRKMIKKFIEENRDMVLNEVMITIMNGSFIERFLFAVTVLFKRRVKK